MIVINGKKYTGNNLQITNNKVFIDGKEINEKEDQKIINISIEGNIESVDVDYCDKIDVVGDVGSINSKNGNVQVKGNVGGDVINKNGNIICRDVKGDVETKNGNITHM